MNALLLVLRPRDVERLSRSNLRAGSRRAAGERSWHYATEAPGKGGEAVTRARVKRARENDQDYAVGGLEPFE